MMRVGGSIGTAVLAVVLARALLSHPHTPAGSAAAFGTAFWWSLALSAISLGPGYALLRAERSARRAKLAAAAAAAGKDTPPDGLMEVAA